MGERGHVVRLTPPQRLWVRVRGIDDAPVQEFGVVFLKPGDEHDGIGNPVPEARHEDGSVEVVAPGEPFSVRVRAEHYAFGTAWPFEPGKTPAEVTVRLQSRIAAFFKQHLGEQR